MHEDQASPEIIATVVELKIAELQVSPGNIIAITAPEDWRTEQIVRFGEFFEAYLKRKGIVTKFLIFPFGTELAIIAHDTGIKPPEPLVPYEEISASPHDDGRDWGFMVESNIWLKLPKVPMLLANLGPPPFDIVLPYSGEIRHIVHNPAEALSNGGTPET